MTDILSTAHKCSHVETSEGWGSTSQNVAYQCSTRASSGSEPYLLAINSSFKDLRSQRRDRFNGCLISSFGDRAPKATLTDDDDEKTIIRQVSELSDVSTKVRNDCIRCCAKTQSIYKEKSRHMHDVQLLKLNKIEDLIKMYHVPNFDPAGEEVRIALLKDVRRVKQGVQTLFSLATAPDVPLPDSLVGESDDHEAEERLQKLVKGSAYEGCHDVHTFAQTCISEGKATVSEYAHAGHLQRLARKGKDREGGPMIRFGDME